MSSSAASVKICLKDTMMHSVLVTKYHIHGCQRVRWSVPKFDKLKNNVIYCGHCEETNWDLTLTKKGQSSFIEVHTNGFNQENRHILFRTAKPSMESDAQLIVEGKFQLKFRNFDWHVLQGKSFEMFFLYYKGSMLPRGVILNNGTRTVRDKNAIGKGLFRMYQRQLFTDFTICVPGRQFRVHKAILAAKSKFFQNYISNLKENVEGKIEIETDPFIMDVVLRFIYSSEVVVRKIDQLKEVSCLAKKLKLWKLIEFCLFRLAINLKDEDDPRIWEVVNDLGLEEDFLDFARYLESKNMKF